MKKIKKGNANNSGNNSKAKLHLKKINYLEKVNIQINLINLHISKEKKQDYL